MRVSLRDTQRCDQVTSALEANRKTHGLSHLDALCLALDLTVSNVVHPSTVHRQHLRRNPT